MIKYFQGTQNRLRQEKSFLSHERSKRAAFNIIGNITHALFGVLDADYAEEMSNIISKVNSNEEYLLHLLKNQTSIIDSTINIIKRGEKDTATQLTEIQAVINNSLEDGDRTNALIKRSQQLI